MKHPIKITVEWYPGHVPPPADPNDNATSVEVLVYTNLDFYCKARYDFHYKEWYITEGSDLEGELVFEENEHVVCWMYFPQPPARKQ